MDITLLTLLIVCASYACYPVCILAEIIINRIISIISN